MYSSRSSDRAVECLLLVLDSDALFNPQSLHQESRSQEQEDLRVTRVRHEFSRFFPDSRSHTVLTDVISIIITGLLIIMKSAQDLLVSTSPAASGSSSPRSPSSQSYSFPVRRSPAQSSPTGGHDSGISCDASLASSPIMGRPFSPSHVRIARRRFPVLLCHSPSLPSIQSSSSLTELDTGLGDQETDIEFKDHAEEGCVEKEKDQPDDRVGRLGRRISFPLDTASQSVAYQQYYQRSECQASESGQTTSSSHNSISGTTGSGTGSVLDQRTRSMLLIPSSKAVTGSRGSDCRQVLRRDFERSGVARRLSNLFPAEAERLSRTQSSFVLNLSKNPSGSSDATLRSVMDRVRIFESLPDHSPLSRSCSQLHTAGMHFPMPMKSVSVTPNDNQSLALFNKLSGRDVSLATVGPDCYVSAHSLTSGSRRYEDRAVNGRTSGDRSHLLTAAAKSRRLILPRIFMIEKALRRKPDRFLLSRSRTSDPVTELEDLVQQLGLDDEDLLDRAERRDLPTRFQLLRPSPSHASAKIDTSLTADDTSHPLLSNEQRLKTSPDLIRGPRAPPVRRSAIPDLIHDDVAFRKLRSKNRQRVRSHPPSASYLLCSPLFTPCDILLPPPTENRPFCLDPEPNVELDDVSYRRITQSEGAKVSDPDPPFGIPKRALVHSASCDYLHAVPDQKDEWNQRKYPSKRAADRVKDDLAIRCWRRDLHEDDRTDNDRHSPPLLPVTTRNVILMNARQALRPSKSYSSLFLPTSSSAACSPAGSNSLLSGPLIPPPPLIDMHRNRTRIERLFSTPGNRVSSHRGTHFTDPEIRSPSARPITAMTGQNRSCSDLTHPDLDRFHRRSRPTDSSNNVSKRILFWDQNQTGTGVLSESPDNEFHDSQTTDLRRSDYCKPVTKAASKVQRVAVAKDGDRNEQRMQEMFAGIIADMRKREIFGRRDSSGECDPAAAFRRLESLF